MITPIGFVQQLIKALLHEQDEGFCIIYTLKNYFPNNIS